MGDGMKRDNNRDMTTNTTAAIILNPTDDHTTNVDVSTLSPKRRAGLRSDAAAAGDTDLVLTIDVLTCLADATDAAGRYDAVRIGWDNNVGGLMFVGVDGDGCHVTGPIGVDFAEYPDTDDDAWVSMAKALRTAGFDVES